MARPARLVLLASLLFVSACGGNVVVDEKQDEGRTTSGGTTSDDNGGPPLCSAASCSGTSDGSCACQTKCDGAEYEVTCGPAGSTCTCMAAGTNVGTCMVSGSDPCSVIQGCCNDLFF